MEQGRKRWWRQCRPLAPFFREAAPFVQFNDLAVYHNYFCSTEIIQYASIYNSRAAHVIRGLPYITSIMYYHSFSVSYFHTSSYLGSSSVNDTLFVDTTSGLQVAVETSCCVSDSLLISWMQNAGLDGIWREEEASVLRMTFTADIVGRSIGFC